jgi:hypothetical protein
MASKGICPGPNGAQDGRDPPAQGLRYLQATGGKTVPDLNEFRRQATAQSQAFHAKLGYPAREVPDIWVGQNVALNMLGGRGTEHLLGPTTASGMLEAISPEGYVLSVEDRVVFIPRESILQQEPYNPDQHGGVARITA